jgi:4-hydroxybenzoate polyprenyltransferase
MDTSNVLTDGNRAACERDDRSLPLCVQLEGALLKSDLLVEGYLRCIKSNVLYALLAGLWLARGWDYLRAEIARRSSLNVDLLPVNTELLAWLESERRQGRRLVLCSAATQEVAESMAARFGIFESTLSCGGSGNVAGRAMASLLNERYGSGGFDYVGNNLNDVAIWENARKAIVVAPESGLRRYSQRLPRLERTFQQSPGSLVHWIRALRLHQWAKNLLIFVPAFASHRVLEPAVARASLGAFLWFSLCASGTYLVNDLLDLDADRAHARKRLRPLASGELSLPQGMVAAFLMIAVAILGATISLGPIFVGVLVLYLIGTLWYSIGLKRIAMVDVLTLAGLYTLRVIAGGAAIAVTPSFYLLGFSMFVFLSLAMVKRYTELRSMASMGSAVAPGRGYRTDDLPLLLACGTATGFASVLVLALYINDGATLLYRYPQVLWLLCPLFMYWICRIWLKTHRGELHDDPIVFAIRDKPSLAVAALCGVLVWVAT